MSAQHAAGFCKEPVLKITFIVFAALGFALAWPAGAQTASKVGVINIQSAIVSTKDGQKAANDINARFNPKKAELDKRQTEIGQLQDQLNRGRNTLSDEARQSLMREIDQKTKSLNRETEDARTELDQAEQKIMGELGGRIMAVIDKYAKDNGYTLIVDVSSPQTPVVYASNTIDITRDIIELYDKNAPAASAAPPPAVVKRPVGSGITRPVAPAPKPGAPPK
jgi:outer membrane protein